MLALSVLCTACLQVLCRFLLLMGGLSCLVHACHWSLPHRLGPLLARAASQVASGGMLDLVGCRVGGGGRVGAES